MKYNAVISKNGQRHILKIKAENETEVREIINDRYNPDYIIEINKHNRNKYDNLVKSSAYDRAWSRKSVPYMKNVNGKVIRIFS